MKDLEVFEEIADSIMRAGNTEDKPEASYSARK